MDAITNPCPSPDADLVNWDRVTHICVRKLATIASDNGLSPSRRQAIIWTNAGILLIGPLWTNFSEILIEIPTVSLKKMHLKMSSGKWRPSCLGLNVLIFVSNIAPGISCGCNCYTGYEAEVVIHSWTRDARDYGGVDGPRHVFIYSFFFQLGVMSYGWLSMCASRIEFWNRTY